MDLRGILEGSLLTYCVGTNKQKQKQKQTTSATCMKKKLLKTRVSDGESL